VIGMGKPAASGRVRRGRACAILAMAAPLVLASVPALAAAPAGPPDDPQHRFFVRLGFGHAGFDTGGVVRVAGQRLPGAAIAVNNNATAVAEVGAFVWPTLSVSLLFGYPPKTALRGQGTIAALGTLGRITYGTTILAAQYHLPAVWRLRPYVGGGIDATYLFDVEDGALRGLRVENSVGPVLQGGFDLPLARRFGVFVDVKKFWLRIGAKATYPSALGPLENRDVVNPDPLLTSIGLFYRF
jgi:outer membrane protein